MATRRSAADRGSEDLFSAAVEDRLRRQSPLAARLRPRTLDEIVGQEHLVGPGRPLRALVEADRLSSAIFWGPPGTGKTTLAQVVAGDAPAEAFEQLSAVTAGGQGRARGDRARPRTASGERGAAARSSSSTRSTASTRRSRTPCSRASRTACSR